MVDNCITNIRDSRQSKNVTNNRETSEDVDGHGEEATKDSDEAIDLNDHAYDGPAKQNHQDAAKEATTAL